MSKNATTPKVNTPAKRRDCLALLCGLPVRIVQQKELVRCGLASGKPCYKYSRTGRRGKLVNPVKLTPKGHDLALRAIAFTAPTAFLRKVERSAFLPFEFMGRVTPARVIEALESVGNYGYGGRLANHTWPMSLDELRMQLNLHHDDKRALSKLLRAMQKEYPKYGVRFAYYPTGWHHSNDKGTTE